MSLGMTTDKTARNSPSQRNARFQLRSSGTRAGRRRVQAGALVRALRLQDDDARRAPAQWSCRKVETVKGSDPSTTPRRLIMLYGKNAGRRTGSAGRPWSRLAPHAVPRPSPNAGAAPAFPALVKRREHTFQRIRGTERHAHRHITRRSLGRRKDTKRWPSISCSKAAIFSRAPSPSRPLALSLGRDKEALRLHFPLPSPLRPGPPFRPPGGPWPPCWRGCWDGARARPPRSGSRGSASAAGRAGLAGGARSGRGPALGVTPRTA